MTTPMESPRAERTSRRDILRAGLAAGVALWASPAINTGRAFAGVAGVCDASGCLGTGWGFSQNVVAPADVYPPAPLATCPPASCQAGPAINQPGPPSQAHPLSVASGPVCACHTFDASTGMCRSEGSIESVAVRLHRSLFRDAVTDRPAITDLVIEADLLSSFTQVECSGCTVERGAQTKNVRFRDPTTGLFISFEDAQPNLVVANSRILYPGFRIVLNEQRCRNGIPNTAALHVRLPRRVTEDGFGRHLFFGFSSAGQSGCEPCSSPDDDHDPQEGLIPIA